MHTHSHSGHSHGISGSPQQMDRAMGVGVALNVIFVIVELGFGFAADSLALISDAGHNAGDVLGLLLAWGALALARRPPSGRYTWGLGRSTIFAALANASLLLVACGVIVWEAVHRLAAPPPVQGMTMIVVAAIGVGINTLTAIWLAAGRKGDANIRGAFLHMAADAAVSAGVVIAGIVIGLTGWNLVDPVVSVVISLLIAWGTWDLLRESVELALDAVPRGVDLARVRSELEAVEGVTAVHDLHIWSASTSQQTATTHLRISPTASHADVLHAATEVLQHTHGVAHTTVQIECEKTAATCDPPHAGSQPSATDGHDHP
jgi:cobalt-zinc-cadmium efflux system protein